MEENLESLFMQEITAPTPQLSRYIRTHVFVSISSIGSESARRQEIQDYMSPSGSIRDAQWQYEQDVYEFARKLGLSTQEANEWVSKAREYWSEKDYDSEESDEFDALDEKSYQFHRSPLLEPSALHLPLVKNLDKVIFTPHQADKESRPSAKFWEASAFDTSPTLSIQKEPRANSDTVEQILADSLMLRLQSHDDEPLIGNVAGLPKEIVRMEAAGKMKGEKATKKNAKKAAIAALGAQNVASGPTAKKKSQESHGPQVGSSGGQESSTSNLEQKEKGKKRKRRPEVSAPSEMASETHHKHKKGKVDRGPRDAHPKKAKKKQDTGPQQSPFFQRNTGPKAKKKDAVKKGERVMDFQSPMIQ